MAEEEVVVPVACPVPSDHKRKLEDLEPTDSERAEQPAESKEKADADNGVAESDLSEAKRPRLDDNNPDSLAIENGGETLEESVKEQDDEKSEEPAEEEQDDEEAVKPNETNEQAENSEHKSEEAEATVKNEQLERMIEQSSADNHVTGVDEQVKVENSDIGQEPPKDEESSQQEIDDGSIISRKIEVPNAKVGVLIGKAGETIRSLQYNSGAKIQIMKDADADRDAPTRPVEIVGTLSTIIKAEKLINAVIEEADAGGSPSLVARGLATSQAAGAVDQIEIQVPNEKVGLIIGRGGDTIKGLQTRSGARIQLLQHLPEGQLSKEKTVRITGDEKQIEMAREMIKDVMNQTVRPSSHFGGFNQQHYRPRGPMGPSQWGPRGHHVQSMPYEYQQRGPYPSQNAHHQAPNYGGYPQQMAPRSNFGSSWDQRPHSMQGPPPQGGTYNYYGRQGASAPLSSSIPGHGPAPSPAPAMGPPPSQSNYNYGQPHGPDYAHPPYPQAAPHQGYGQGYEEHKYGNHAAVQHPYGAHGASQPGYTQSGPQQGFAPQQPYGKPPSYGVLSQGHHPQTYGPPTSQPGDMAYPGPASAQYSSSVPPQQQYPYGSGGSVQQSYPPYGSAPPSDAYNQASTATAPVYPQQGNQPVPSYGQPAAPSYAQVGADGYGQYPSSQQGYTEQPAGNNANYGYQGLQDPSYGGGAGSTYSAPGSQPGYAQPATTQPGFDQNASQSGGYGATAGGAPAPYAKTVSPQPGYPQYDSTQMYAAPH
ncbi:hypothetical protein SLE2022_116490 [Rubroshorea leprosula]